MSSDGRRRTFWEYVPCTESSGQANEFELISTVKMETRHPVEGYFGNEFPSIYNHCGVRYGGLKSQDLQKGPNFCVFWKKTPRLRKNFDVRCAGIYSQNTKLSNKQFAEVQDINRNRYQQTARRKISIPRHRNEWNFHRYITSCTTTRRTRRASKLNHTLSYKVGT